jgi:hypothetical protein
MDFFTVPTLTGRVLFVGLDGHVVKATSHVRSASEHTQNRPAWCPREIAIVRRPALETVAMAAEPRRSRTP